MQKTNSEKHGYKKTKIGWIPEDWQLKKLGKLFSFRNGVNASKEDYGQGIKFVNVMDVLENTFITEEKILGSVQLTDKQIEKNIVKKGDVLFNRTSETQDEIGLTALYNDDAKAVFGGFVIRGRPKNNAILPEFNGYSFHSELVRKQIISKGQGAVRVNIGQSDLEQVKLPLPPLPEQKKIAEILTTWDRAIETLEQLIVKKEELKKGLMQQLLTSEKRLPGFKKEWEKKRLYDVLKRDKIKGKSVNLNENQLGVPYIGSVEFEGDFDKYTDDPNAVLVKKNDILILWDGEYAGKVTTNLEGSASSTVAILRIKGNDVDNYFLAQRMLYDNPKIRAVTEGSGIPHIPKDFTKWYNIYLPSLEEQKSIRKILELFDKEIFVLQEEKKLIVSQKTGLMQQLLTGKTRVEVQSN